MKILRRTLSVSLFQCCSVKYWKTVQKKYGTKCISFAFLVSTFVYFLFFLKFRCIFHYCCHKYTYICTYIYIYILNMCIYILNSVKIKLLCELCSFLLFGILLYIQLGVRLILFKNIVKEPNNHVSLNVFNIVANPSLIFY